ncbi:MAG TPA: hypothetical protein VFL36_03680 [Myxococcales bacterium]|nr:hypothetical protein [Myxococcales bacterium]
MLLFLLATLVRGPADVASLTAASDAVVHAQVVRRTSAWGAGGGQIFTTVVLRALETWKGEPAAEVTVLVPGGEVGELTQTVQGVAQFHDGEEVVVFLRRRARGLFAVERFALGKFAVGAPAGLPLRAIRDRRGLDCQGCRPDEADDFSLDQLRARVLGSLSK